MYWRWFAGPADLARGAGRVRAEHAAAAVRGQVWGAEALWRWPQFRFVGENWLHLSDLRESHGGVYSPRVYRALEQDEIESLMSDGFVGLLPVSPKGKAAVAWGDLRKTN